MDGVYGLGCVSPVKGKAGTRYKVRVPDGAGGYRNCGRFDSEEEARGVLLGLAAKRAQGELALSGTTLREWGQRFLELPTVRSDVGWTYLVMSEQDRICSAEGIPFADRMAIAFAIGSGLRQGEQWTLHLADVHAFDEHPHVIVRYGGRKRGQFQPPKNGKIRRVELFGRALEAARAWLAELPRWCPHNSFGLMWPTKRGCIRRDSKAPRGWSTPTRATQPHDGDT